ncbi:MAG: hypothetical protein ACI85F_003005 [Bacteroidia bacterium]|jgi:hypothetical protein
MKYLISLLINLGLANYVAKPDLHLIRGANVPVEAREAIEAKNVPGMFGEYLFGYVKDEYKRPDPAKAIQLTAKWTCKSEAGIEELIYWWQRLGTDAHSMEKGLVR